MTDPVFTATELAGIRLPNRILRAATHEGMADERGFPTEKLRRFYVRLARGGAGAIITGYTGIRQDGKSPQFHMSMITNDAAIPAYRRITEAVHEFGTPIIMQLAHCGRQTRSKITGLPTVAPSAVRDGFYGEDRPEELTGGEIETIIDNFVDALARAKKAGFDGVQLHMAHGYLLSEFLSSHANRRRDRWGGSLENKYRIIGEIFSRARERVGDFPILAKINAYDGRKRGMRPDEAAAVARLLEKSGCAAVEISCGVFEDGFSTIRGTKPPVDAIIAHTFKYKHYPDKAKKVAARLLKIFLRLPGPVDKYNLDAALHIKKRVNIPVIVVGGINNLADIREIISRHGIDYVSMARPFIIEQNIVDKFRSGRQERSRCIMCNYCAVIGEERPLKCYYGRLP